MLKRLRFPTVEIMVGDTVKLNSKEYKLTYRHINRLKWEVHLVPKDNLKSKPTKIDLLDYYHYIDESNNNIILEAI